MHKHLNNARCLELGLDPNIFFPEKDHLGQIAYAKAICAECSIREECLDLAITTREEHGIWGGTTEKERETIRVQMALRDYASRHKKPHEPLHPSGAFPAPPSYTSDPEIHTPQVLLKDFALRIASRVSGIEVSALQSPAVFPLGPNQKSLFELLQGEFEKFQVQLSRRPGYNPQSRLMSGRELRQTYQEPVFGVLFQEQPTQLLVPDLFLVAS